MPNTHACTHTHMHTWSLHQVGDLPDADIKAPENVLFVCKLNPVTTDEDLRLIFARFGKILSVRALFFQRLCVYVCVCVCVCVCPRSVVVPPFVVFVEKETQ